MFSEVLKKGVRFRKSQKFLQKPGKINAHKVGVRLIWTLMDRAFYNDRKHQFPIAKQRRTDESLTYVGMDINLPPPDSGTVATNPWMLRKESARVQGLGPNPKWAFKFIKKEGKSALVNTV